MSSIAQLATRTAHTCAGKRLGPKLVHIRHFARSTLRVNAERLNATLHETCEFGAAMRYGPGPTETGMARLALDDDDARARNWFVSEMRALGCKVSIDQMGNVFAVRAGKRAGAPTAMGSHLDTQPTGGRYDGILGMMAGIEAVRTMNGHKFETEYPVAVVNWTNEEGARFPKSVVSSQVWAGIMPLEDAWSLQDVSNPKLTMRSELERIGYLGDIKCSHKHNSLAAHFELHIEQGPILEEERAQVGVVHGAQAYKWFTLDIRGRACHTGTTPYRARSDALLLASRIMVANAALAQKHGGLASTGVLSLSPGSVNVTPSHVRMSLDIRHPRGDILDVLVAEVRTEAERLAKDEASGRGCALAWAHDSLSPQIVFHPDCIDAVRAAAVATVGEGGVRKMFSGAGHDSCATSTVCPTAMIFVPSKDGISHNPTEYTSPEQCAIGAQVLLQAVLNYDARRTQ